MDPPPVKWQKTFGKAHERPDSPLEPQKTPHRRLDSPPPHFIPDSVGWGLVYRFSAIALPFIGTIIYLSGLCVCVCVCVFASFGGPGSRTLEKTRENRENSIKLEKTEKTRENSRKPRKLEKTRESSRKLENTRENRENSRKLEKPRKFEET